jgi:hypothetical protein
MTAAIIEQDTSLSTVLEHSTYTLTRLEAHPLTRALAPPFVAFQQSWAKTDAQELEHRLAILRAIALVAAADDDLDIFVDKTSNVILSLTGNDRDAALYKQYFGERRPSELKRPVLGAQLDTMRAWVPSLKASSHKQLAQIGVDLEPKIAAADMAKTRLTTAQHESRVFRATGERRALIDHFNALRKDTYGKIAGMPHKHPDENLPGSFADRFFKSVSRANAKGVEELSSVDILAQIAEAETDLSALRDRLKEAQDREAREAKAKETEAADDAELLALEQEREALEAKIAAKKAKRDR